MVIRILFMTLLFTCFSPSTMAKEVAPAFNLEPASTQFEYGKPISIILSTIHEQPRLDIVDLSPLTKDFVIETREDVEHDTKTAMQSWRIRLYPRYPGELVLPALTFQTSRTEPVRLNVAPAIDRKDNAAIHVNTEVNQTSVWLKQAVRVTMQIETVAEIVVLDTQTATYSNVEITSLPLQRHNLTHKGQPRTRHQLKWLLYPQTPGAVSIQLPPLRYIRDGVNTHRFYPPKLILQVKALPAYVPATMPVGRIKLDAVLPDRFFFVTDKLTSFSLQLAGEGLQNQYLGGILRQLKSDQTLSLYPARLNNEDTFNDQDIVGHVSYQIPFVPKTMGITSLPSIRLQYFDPLTGKIQTQHYSLGSFFVISQWVVYVVTIALVVGAIILLRLTYRKLKQSWHVYQFYRAALHKLQRAETPSVLKSALMDIAQAEAWPTNLTLAVWLQHWRTRYPRMSFVSERILRLEAWLYGKTEATLDEIRPALITICYRRMPLLKILG